MSRVLVKEVVRRHCQRGSSSFLILCSSNGSKFVNNSRSSGTMPTQKPGYIVL